MSAPPQAPPSAPSRPSPRRRPLAVAAAVLVVAVLVALVRTYVVPPVDAPGPTDAVVVLGGVAFGARLDRAGEVVAAHPGAAVLVARPAPAARYCPEPLEGAASTTCFTPRPDTTRGEARTATALARAGGASSMTVVVTADQVVRARLRFERCWAGELRVVEAPTSLWRVVRNVPYQVAATAKALVWERSC